MQCASTLASEEQWRGVKTLTFNVHICVRIDFLESTLIFAIEVEISKGEVAQNQSYSPSIEITKLAFPVLGRAKLSPLPPDAWDSVGGAQEYHLR
jgi:hypothetical protein